MKPVSETYSLSAVPLLAGSLSAGDQSDPSIYQDDDQES